MQREVDPSQVNPEEERIENSLRPHGFKDVIGRENEKKSLEIMIKSAKKRKMAVDHILFHGPPGLGKTSLAHVVANEMGVNMHVTNGGVIEKSGDLAAILTNLEPYSVLFIDEIHRLRQNIEEVLYPAMEDNVLDILIGKGPGARTLRLDLPPFSVIGATTKLSKISNPLRDRFGMTVRLDFYSDNELKQLINQKAKLLGISVEDEAASHIASRSRMTARISIRILKRARDLAIVNNKDIIDVPSVRETLKLMDIDQNGLDILDRRILEVILHNFSNRPVGLSTLSASLSEEEDTIENVYEPYLIKKGLLQRTTRGRIVTDEAIRIYGNKNETIE